MSIVTVNNQSVNTAAPQRSGKGESTYASLLRQQAEIEAAPRTAFNDTNNMEQQAQTVNQTVHNNGCFSGCIVITIAPSINGHRCC